MSGSNLDVAIAAYRDSVGELIAAAEKTGSAWSVPRAAGKWSPGEIVEHVSIALEESAHVAAGQPSKFPRLPWFVRPVVRTLFFNRIVRSGKFPKARAPKALSPTSAPATPAAGRARLEGASAAFEHACRARAAAGKDVDSEIFGVAPVSDFVRFQELHTRHHTRQLA